VSACACENARSAKKRTPDPQVRCEGGLLVLVVVTLVPVLAFVLASIAQIA
jgi:hypothetical protein